MMNVINTSEGYSICISSDGTISASKDGQLVPMETLPLGLNFWTSLSAVIAHISRPIVVEKVVKKIETKKLILTNNKKGMFMAGMVFGRKSSE